MSLVSRVQQIATQHPEKIAYHFMGSDTTYAEFEHSIERFATALRSLGIEKGDHVGFLLGNSPHFLISLYATMRLGATAVPINPIYTPDEISYIVKNSDAKAIIALDALLPLVERAAGIFTSVENYVICETQADTVEKLATLPDSLKAKVKSFSFLIKSTTPYVTPVEVSEEDTAVILYTSGTTGHPKGAMLTYKNIYSNARDVAEYLSINTDDRVITTLPVFHVFALTVVVNAPLLVGATLLLVPKFSPQDVFKIAKEHKATIFAGVPTMFNFLYQYPEGDVEDFSTIRLAISGGSSLPVALLHNFEEKFNVRISEGYGLSEASPVTCFNPIDRERKPGSIGTNIVNVENKVVNELGEEVPVGEVGELIVRGPNVMKGYYKMPEETENAIRNGWLYTGDLARQDEEGYFYIVDRKKDMIIVGGYNVYPREVEEVLFGHPGIVEAAVVGIPDLNFGEEVLAFVVKKDTSLTEEQLYEYCTEKLAKYKIPKKFEFLEELPKNTTGKILRRSLKEQTVQ
ncbi:fatty acid--CoA ligase family protein [Bacillus sp. Cr_A10]|uniref:fatty acid--CoA ligase family protein n=1 Tax=Bacillus sp. Cr_A10 TaxID=3033993 RepID=UPI0023DA4B6C|nr:fatty acid--CoA ligase family protein [Bacillus sp. Cr_A10]MDF2065193.1 fatty acid--CoA ligase family protein [Bacillus sp. Cr_A10]